MDHATVDGEEYREVVARYRGSVVVARIRNGGLMVCPVCGKYYFSSEKDLILHIISHAKQELYRYTDNGQDKHHKQ